MTQDLLPVPRPNYAATLRELLTGYTHAERVTFLRAVDPAYLRQWHRERGLPGSYCETFRAAIADALEAGPREPSK